MVFIHVYLQPVEHHKHEVRGLDCISWDLIRSSNFVRLKLLQELCNTLGFDYHIVDVFWSTWSHIWGNIISILKLAFPRKMTGRKFLFTVGSAAFSARLNKGCIFVTVFFCTYH